MDLKLLQAMVHTSRENESKYSTFFDWKNYNPENDHYFMEPELLSLYHLPIYNELTPQQISKLSHLEGCQIIYCYAYTEWVMCYFLAKYLLTLPYWSPEYNFIVREQVEEYRHQDMFSRALELLKSEHLPIKGFLKRQSIISAKILWPKRFFLLQIAVELISDDFGKLCYSNPNVSKIVQDISKFHHIEETRHITYAKMILDDKLSDLNFFERTFWGIALALDVYFINAGYIREEFYKKIWLNNTKQLYKQAIAHYKQNAKKNFLSPEGKKIMQKYRLLTRLNKPIIKRLTGISQNDLHK